MEEIMKILEFEKLIRAYKCQKIEEFSQLKKYLTNLHNYEHNFCPEEISEGYIENCDYYSTYVFDENDISKRKVKSVYDSGWKTTIIMIKSYDKINIDGYYLHHSNGLTTDEMRNFLSNIKLLGENKEYEKK